MATIQGLTVEKLEAGDMEVLGAALIALDGMRTDRVELPMVVAALDRCVVALSEEG